MVDNIANTVMHAATQTALGVAVGGVCEAVFPAAKPLGPDGSGVLTLAGEIVAQLVVNSLAFIATAKLSAAADDQSGALVYSYALFECQPSLRHKLKCAGAYVTSFVAPSKVSETFTGPPVTASQKQKMRERY